MIVMEQKTIYLAYTTDAWMSKNSRNLEYVGDNIYDVAAQITHFFRLSHLQEKELIEKRQTTDQIVDCKIGFLIEEVTLNAFV